LFRSLEALSPKTQKKPSKAGRPPLPEGDAKAVMLRVRVTPDELRTFDRAAKASNQKRSEWIRNILTTAVEQR
jgi:hypothetical protein